jgi:hypothetical protein
LNEVFRVEELHEAELRQWNEFVRQHELGLVYHLSDWIRAVEQAFPHIRGRILVIRNSTDRKIIAGIPVAEVRSRLLGNRIVSIPFATLCDPLVSSAEQLQAFVAFLAAERGGASENHPVRIGARRAAAFFNASDMGCRTDFVHHFLELNAPFEKLQKSFSKTAVRQMVCRAQRSGIVVECFPPESAMKTFYDLYCTTRRGLGLPAMPLHFFEYLYSNLGSEKIILSFARRDEKTLGAILATKWKSMFSVECVGEQAGARKLGVNQLLWWEAIRRACGEGYSVFSFGRTHKSNTGLMDYKRRWGAREESLPLFIHPVSATQHTMDSETSRMTRVMRRVASLAPISLYRSFSAACYRHLG